MRLVLLGRPVSHSRSPAIHRAALAACGIAGDYTASDVDGPGFAAACRDVAAGRFDGANVTMPYKRAAREACAVVDRDADRAAAVNTVMGAGQGRLAGWNTDVVALRHALDAMGTAPVLVLGAGGAAAAALVAADRRSVWVAARRPEASRDLASRYGAAAVDWGTPRHGAIVVNATSLGMKGEGLPEGILEAAAGLVDLAYGPQPTPASAAMAAEDRPVVDGLTLLVDQAAASFELWTGHPAPRGVMEAAARTPDSLKAT